MAPPSDTEGIAESEFEMEFDEGSGVLAWQYDTTLYGEARVGVMADTLGRVLAHCAVSRAFPSWNRSVLTEIYLCHACSRHEILRVETLGQERPTAPLPSPQECAGSGAEWAPYDEVLRTALPPPMVPSP
eukprot:COSAG01_NODE_11096_length_2009_cov_4.966492_1_plen_130_part_00